MIHHSARLPVSFSPFERLSIITTALLFTSGLLTGCATTTPSSGAYEYEFQSLHRFVRLESIEADSPNNYHPVKVSPQSLQALFSELKASGNVKLFGEIAAFTEDELDEVAGPISNALARARPDQDVTFQSSGSRGVFDKHTARTYTSGRVFVRDGQLNLILGVLHSGPDPDDSDFADILYPTGSRAGRAESGWELSQGNGQLVDGRGDWVRFSMTGKTDSTPMGGKSEMASPMPTATDNKTLDSKELDSAVDRQSQKIGSRLRVLDDLKAKDLITDEEYRAKRKAILDGI